MDSMLADYYNAIQQRRFREGMQSLNQQAIRETGSDFMKMSTDQRAEFFTEVDKVTIEQIRQGTGNYRPFFRTLKELTWIGFFTSETIGEEYLAYDPVPGRYDGCLPFEENGGKQWSL